MSEEREHQDNPSADGRQPGDAVPFYRERFRAREARAGDCAIGACDG